MATEIIMPQMGESIAEGTITRWLVAVGDQIERDQPLLEISTDKVDAEIPSPATGVLTEILFQEGDTVEVDTVIGYLGTAEEAAGSGAAPKADAEAASTTAAAAAPAVAETSAEVSAAPVQGAEESAPGSLEERVRTASSPVVRKIAAEEGVDIAQVPGTGIHGRVTKKDILQYLESRPEDASATAAADVSTDASTGASAAPSAAPTGGSMVTREAPAPQTVHPRAASSDDFAFSVPAYTEGERVEIEPMSRVRRLTAAHMLYSRQTSAHVATVFEIDMTNVVAARAQAKNRFLQQAGTKLTYMPFIFKAVTDALSSYPKFNASLSGTDIVYKKDVNLGMAVAVDWGLLVPVIANADQLNLVGLARAANDLADRARTKKLKPEEVQRGTFTVTNPGVFGSLYGIPIINQPQVAILCIGSIGKRPVVVTDELGNDSIAIRTMSNFCLSYDHRLIDGADAEQFMNRIKKTLTTSTWDELDSFRG